jgi:hypothetical protein
MRIFPTLKNANIPEIKPTDQNTDTISIAAFYFREVKISRGSAASEREGLLLASV